MKPCYASLRRSKRFWLIGALSIACLLHDQAAAEAYTSISARRSNLWNRSTAATTGILDSKKNDSHLAARLTSSRLCSGGGEVETANFWNKSLFHELVAEMIGTFMIVQLGTGAVMSSIYCNALSLFQVAAVWSVAVTLAICTTGPISGAHLNPSITMSLALFRDFEWKKVPLYSVAQLVGAIFASATNLLLYARKIQEFEAANAIVRGAAMSIASAKAFGQYFENPIGTAGAFLAEAVGTAVLSFTIFSLTNSKNDSKQHVPSLIGATVGSLICVIAPLTQAGFNPARDFGPRIVAYFTGWKMIAMQGWWVYVVAPLVGAPIGAWVADKLLYGNDKG